MRRELDEIEYFNWCIGQPYNLVVAVQVRGDLLEQRERHLPHVGLPPPEHAQLRLGDVAQHGEMGERVKGVARRTTLSVGES
jgi:hypothetical protein